MKQHCFAKDQIIKASEASLHPMDIAVIRGYGIFDFFRTSNYTPLFLEDYLNRFLSSANKTRLIVGYDKDSLKEIILELIAKNDLKDGGIRMVLTGGVSENQLSPSEGTLFIFCEDLHFPSTDAYSNGVKLKSEDHVRAIADIKTTNYNFPVWLSGDWKSNGFEDVIYYHNQIISESSRSNIFIIKNGEIHTPNEHILHGITRKRVLELAEKVEIRPITFEECLNADEVFMTSTTKKILPVTQIDDKRIGNGRVGKVTSELMHKFKEMEMSYLSNQTF
jgi:branched-chain amino acid aminotransferase